MATYAAVLRGKGCSFKFHKRGSLPTFAASSQLDENGLRRRLANFISVNGGRVDSLKTIYKGPASTGGARAHAPNAARQPHSSTKATPTLESEGEHVLPPMLEGSGALDRDRGFKKRTVRECNKLRSDNLLGEGHKDHTPKPFSTTPLRHCNWARNARTRAAYPNHEPRATTLLHDSPRDGPSNTINTRSGVRDALYQKGGNHSSVSRNLSRKFAHAGGSKPNKTPEHRITAQIQCKQRYNGTGPRDTTSVCTPSGTLTTSHVTKCFHEVPYLRRHSVICARRSSRLARPKDMSLPLHVKKSIPVIKLDKVKEWLNPAAATRFRKVLNELLWVPTGPYPEPSVRGSLPEEDIRLLEGAGVISKVSGKDLLKRPSMQYMIPFTVVETDDEGNQRRRFISWTRDDNNRLLNYEPEVALYHPSKYLHKAHDAMAVKRDFTCGFYQISIPLKARPKFRFRSTLGEVFEMNVLPMGHRCAPEIMHTVTAAIAGERSVCQERFSFHRGATDVYVDGVRFSGTANDAVEYARFIDERCSKANGLFKDAGQPPALKYVFNGVAFDHDTHTVCLGPRVVSKLQKDKFHKLSFRDLEAAVGRLLYGSAVLRLNMPRFYFAMKVAQRRINLLNRCPYLIDKPVDLPVVTRSTLTEWRNELICNLPRPPPPHPDTVPHHHKLYTDASAKGWGAIIYLDSGEVLITGEAWPKNFKYEVNRAEAMAVRLAIKKFAMHSPKGTCLDIFVDNTSCKAALNRRLSNQTCYALPQRNVLGYLRG